MNKLHRIHSPWNRLLISLCLTGLLVINQFIPPRARAHWVGGLERPRRLERLFILLLFETAMLTLRARDYALWSTLAGGMTSIFLVLYMIYWLFPRKRAHRWNTI